MLDLAFSRRRSDPLTVFVHIPKTAGSSVNRHLSQGLGPGSRRIIHMLNRPGLLRWTLARARWVSGHVYYPRMQRHLSAETDRELRYFIVFRDPVRNLASHYNWYIEVHRRGPSTYYRYSRYQRDLSEQIREADNSDPAAVIEILKQHHGTFLNHQTRYLVGDEGLHTADDAAIRAALSTFAFAGRTDRLDSFYDALGIRGDSGKKVNTSPYGFDPEVFRSPEMTRFLAKGNALDNRLYEIISEKD